MNETSLRRQIANYVEYYHESRCQLSLEKDFPDERAVEPPELGQIVAVPMVGGLRHRCESRAAWNRNSGGEFRSMSASALTKDCLVRFSNN